MTDKRWARDGGLYLGYQQERLGIAPSLKHERNYIGDRMLFNTGPNGAGKTRRLALVNLCRLLGWSMVVVDTKGVLYAMTHELRKASGCEEFIFNPANVGGYGTMSHNPVASLDPKSDDFVDDVMEHSETNVTIGDTRETHWPEAGQDLHGGIEMYVSAVVKNGSLPDVRALAAQSDQQIRLMIKNTPFKYKGESYLCIREAADHFDLPEMYNKVARYEDMKPEDREQHSVFSTMLTQTRSFDSRNLKKVLSGDAIDFSSLKRKPSTVYLIVPPRRLQTYAKWIRIMLASILQANMQDVKRAEVPIMIWLDEAYPILYGGFPILEQNYAQLREFGIKIGLSFQSLAQPMMLWGDKGFENYIGNAGVFQSFAPQDNVTAEYLSNMSGETTEWHMNEGGQRGFANSGASINESGGISEFGRPLLLPHELREMEDGWTVAWSHRWKGTALSYVPYPSELGFMRDIMKLDPAV